MDEVEATYGTPEALARQLRAVFGEPISKRDAEEILEAAQGNAHLVEDAVVVAADGMRFGDLVRALKLMVRGEKANQTQEKAREIRLKVPETARNGNTEGWTDRAEPSSTDYNGGMEGKDKARRERAAERTRLFALEEEEAKASGYANAAAMWHTRIAIAEAAEQHRKMEEETGPGAFDFDGIPRYDTLGIEQMQEGEWIVDGVLPSQSISLIYGKSGSWKTFFALDLALSVASGIDFLGKKTRQASVAFFYLEGTWTARERVGAWQKAHKIERVRGFGFFPRRMDITDKEERKRLITRLQAVPDSPRLIIFDTLSALMAGDGNENDTQDMQKFVGACRVIRDALGATVLVVHHQQAFGYMPRGSTVLFNDSDTVWQLKKDTKKGSIYCSKQRGGGPRFETIPFTTSLVDYGGPKEAPVLVYAKDAFLESEGGTVDDEAEQQEIPDTLPANLEDSLDALRAAKKPLSASEWASRRHAAIPTINAHAKELIKRNLVHSNPDGRNEQNQKTTLYSVIEADSE